MILAEAFQDLRRKAESGKIPNRKSGGYRKLSCSEVAVIESHVRGAVRAASGHPDPDQVEITPILDALIPALHRDAEVHGRDARREISSVRLFIQVVKGHEPNQRQRVLGPQQFLAPWVPLYEALEELLETNPTARTTRKGRYRGFLYQLMSYLVGRGVIDPYDAPEYDVFRQWCHDDGVSERDQCNWASALRETRRLTGDERLPFWYATRVGFDKGLKGLPNLSTLVATAVEARPAGAEILADRDPYDLQTLDLVEILAPKLGEAARLYVEGVDKSPAWIHTVRTTFSILVRMLLELGQDVGSMDLIDLFCTHEEVEASGDRHAVGLLRRHLEGTRLATVVLFRQFLDASALASWERSPLTLISKVPDGEVSWYTNAIFNEASAIWAVTEWVYGHGAGHIAGGLASHRPAQWALIRGTYDLCRQHAILVNSSREVLGHKDNAIIDVTLAQAVCVALPRLRAEVLALRDLYFAADHESPGSNGTKTARDTYFRRLETYVVSALMLDDGLRIQNYARGRVNIHFIPEVQRDADGNWIRITCLTTSWRGYDSKDVRLKIRRDSSGRERSRTRQVLAGILDMDLLSDWWLLARPVYLAARGFIASADSYDPDQDTWVLFPSKSSTHPYGAYSTPRLSLKVGRFLHWTMRDVMKREIPDWETIRRHRQFRGIFGAHSIRHLIATYWGGIREMWTRAVFLTNDSVGTLQGRYTTIEPLVREAKTRDGPEHPNFFDADMDMIYNGESVK